MEAWDILPSLKGKINICYLVITQSSVLRKYVIIPEGEELPGE
jgi:hypothetical protein